MMQVRDERSLISDSAAAVRASVWVAVLVQDTAGVTERRVEWPQCQSRSVPSGQTGLQVLTVTSQDWTTWTPLPHFLVFSDGNISRLFIISQNFQFFRKKKRENKVFRVCQWIRCFRWLMPYYVVCLFCHICWSISLLKVSACCERLWSDFH